MRVCVCMYVLVWFHKGNKWAKVQCTAFNNNKNNDNKINRITTITNNVWLCYVVDCWCFTGDDLFEQWNAVGSDEQVQRSVTTMQKKEARSAWSEKVQFGIVANEVKEFLLLPTHIAPPLTVWWWCIDVEKCTLKFKWSRSTEHPRLLLFSFHGHFVQQHCGSILNWCSLF